MNRVRFAASAAALIVAGAAIAHPHPGGEGGKKVEKIVVITEHADHKGKGMGDAKRVHTFHLDRDKLAMCEGGHKLVDETAGDEKEKTKVVICSKGADGKVDADRLEQALARINANDNLSAEHKERIGAALRAAIERTRSAN